MASPFTDTSKIELNILLDSVAKAENFIRLFATEHLKAEAFIRTRNASAVIMLRRTDVEKKGHALKTIYQNVILPYLEKELKDVAFTKIKAKWDDAGKPTTRKRSVAGATGRVEFEEEVPEFEQEVNKLFEKKKNTKGSEYKRRLKEQTRIGSATNIVGKIQKPETDLPSGYKMDDDGNSEEPDTPKTPNNEKPDSELYRTCPQCRQSKLWSNRWTNYKNSDPAVCSQDCLFNWLVEKKKITPKRCTRCQKVKTPSQSAWEKRGGKFYCGDIDCSENRYKKSKKPDGSPKPDLGQLQRQYLQILTNLSGWGELLTEDERNNFKNMIKKIVVPLETEFEKVINQARIWIAKKRGENPDEDDEKDNQNLPSATQKAIQEIENELNKEPKITLTNEKWRTYIENSATLVILHSRKQKILADIRVLRQQQKGGNENHNLTELRTYTIHQIKQALNLNPPVSSSELTNPNWETEINQLSSKSAIEAIKDQVLADIKNKRATKNELSQITELLAQAEGNWNNYQNLANILQQIKKYRSSYAYSAKKAEIQALEKRLQELNPADYQSTTNNLLDQQIQDNGLNEENMDEKTKQAIAEAKADATPEKVAQAEERIVQNGVDNNLTSLLTQIETQLQKGNLSQSDKEQLITQLNEFITGKSAFHAKAYFKKKPKIDALLAELRGGKNNHQTKSGMSWPKKLGIAALVILPLIIIILLLWRARRKKLDRARWVS